MKEINLKEWDRYSHYKTFKNIEKPQFSICTKVDVSSLVNKRDNFFNIFLYNLLQASNDVYEFRLRIKDQKVFEHDKLDININILGKNNCFASKRITYSNSFKEFNENVNILKNEPLEQGVLSIDKEQEDNVVITSYLPWVHFDSISEPIFSKDESLIKIVYGKYSEVNGKYMIPICVTANHALLDGYHMGEFFEKLSTLCS